MLIPAWREQGADLQHFRRSGSKTSVSDQSWAKSREREQHFSTLDPQNPRTDTGPNTSHSKAPWLTPQKSPSDLRRSGCAGTQSLFQVNTLPLQTPRSSRMCPSPSSLGELLLPAPPRIPTDPNSPSPTSAPSVPAPLQVAPRHTLAPCQDSGARGWKGARGCRSSSCRPCSP